MEEEKRRKNMQKIKSKDTSIIVIASAMKRFLANRTSYSQNIKLLFSAMVNFFMEKTGKFYDLD